MRPARRLRPPLELTLAGSLAGASLALYRLVPRQFQLATSLIGAAGFVAGGRAAGASWDQLGLGPGAARRGVKVGLAGAVPVAAAIAAAAVIPATRKHFHDDRVRRVDARRALREVALLIPFQTALPEEVVFRGVVLGLLLRRRRTVVAVAAGSALFGLWHVLPTLGTMGDNATTASLAERPAHRAGLVAGAVALTTVAGVGFALLRLRSGSVIAPTIAHAATNGLAFVAAYTITRLPPHLAGR